MKSFTMGTSEMLAEMIEKLPDMYPMELREDDMTALVTALATAVGYVSWDDVPEDVRDHAESLFSSIAETLDIEGI